MNPISQEPYDYQAYMLRLWRTQCKGQWQWRASLENPHTGERLTFASLEQCFNFLCEQCNRQVTGAVDGIEEG